MQAVAHYRSREHLNRRLQRGLPVAELPSSEQDPSSTSRHFINHCLRLGVQLQPPNVPHPQPGIAFCFISNYPVLIFLSGGFVVF